MIQKALYSIFIFISFFSLYAQDGVVPLTVIKRHNTELASDYREPFEKKREVIFNNKRYRIYNNYFTAGAGKSYNSGWKDFELSTAFDFNFHADKKYFQVGGILTGPGLGNNNCLQFHACWGYRIERYNYQWAAYGGVSYTDGYYLQTGYMQQPDTTYKVKFGSVGAYAAVQFFYKLKFDYGLGLTAFIDANSKQTVSGIRLELFFSGAYRGLKKIDYSKEEE
jgi:hypothetical protein